MLREITSVRQIPGEHPRRWFTDDMMDLYIWQDTSGTMHSFQVCYDKSHVEKALTWKMASGFEYHCVESSDDPFDQKTPILHSQNLLNRDELIEMFMQHAETIPSAIKNLVLARLHELPLCETEQDIQKSSSRLTLLQRIMALFTGKKF